MYDLYERGMFGNKLRTWIGTRALWASMYTGDVSIRCTTSAGAKLAAYRVPATRAYPFLREQGIDDEFVMERVAFNESAPDDRLIIQGEIQEIAGVLHVRFSSEKGKKMREAMEHSAHWHGLLARNLLRGEMSPGSYDDVCELLDTYPGHVVEFSTYDHFLGSCHRRNTVIWEVRKY